MKKAQESVVHGSLNQKPYHNYGVGEAKSETQAVLEEWHSRPQTICVVAYYAQWKHIMQALMIDWLRSGGTRDDLTDYHLKVLRPLMSSLDARQDILYYYGKYVFRKQGEMERRLNPIENRSIGLTFTPAQWYGIAGTILNIAAFESYIYPDVALELWRKCNLSLDELIDAEKQHPRERFYLTIYLNKGFVQGQAPALYNLPFIHWYKQKKPIAQQHLFPLSATDKQAEKSTAA